MASTILVVEDDKELRENMESFLSGKGYSVVTSCDGWSCLKEIVVKKPDLVLMDINMPKLNGLNALDLIKVTRLTVRIPIIVMSAKADAETIQKAIELGADDFIEKPFSYERAASLIELQLFSLNEEMVRAMLSNLQKPAMMPEYFAASSAGFSEHFDAYPVTHQGQEIYILLLKTVNPQAAAKLPKEKLAESMIVFAKGENKWRRLFPEQTETSLKAA